MRRPIALALASVVAVAAVLSAQAAYQGYVQGGDLGDIRNTPYDGRFTFFRVRFEPMGGDGRGWRVDRKWDHDVPRAEIHFMRILRELSTMRPYMEGGNIFALDDPEIFRYPIAYLSEPGFWTPTEKEAAALRAYLQKGGFLIFDDFVGPHWYNFEERMRQVLPQARLVELDASHPIFDSFFRIESLDVFGHPYFGAQAKFYGIFEDNDPKKRLMVIANYNNDLGDFMEFSDEGFLPIQLTNEAYKLSVNYVMYAMTH